MFGVDSLIEQIAEQRREKLDDAFWSAMEHHGYSKEWCLHPDNKDQIEIITIGQKTDLKQVFIVTIDGFRLFSMTLDVRVNQDYCGSKVIVTVDVEHFKN